MFTPILYFIEFLLKYKILLHMFDAPFANSILCLS